MQSFISETLDDILRQQDSFENTVFILPSQRAGVFVKQAFKEKLTVGFLPEIISIEKFIEDVSGIRKIDAIQLLFHFYTCYKNLEPEPESFDTFSSWAHTILQDFSDVDQHLVTPKEIFTYLKDIQRLKEWSIKNPIHETELMKNHFSFMEKLNIYYSELYSFLMQQKIGYQGLVYREATHEINNYCEKNEHKNFYFMGFNALNKAEEFIIQEMLSEGKTNIYWDIDTEFLKGNHQAGIYINRYKNEWKYYEKNQLKTISSSYVKNKNIEIIGATKNTTQIKHIGELIEKLPSIDNTALVLADESLLPIALNSLPKKVDAINITMGYPLKDVPTKALFTSIFNMFLTQEHLQKTTTNEFYYKDVLKLLKQPAIRGLIIVDDNDAFNDFLEKVHSNNITFISHDVLSSFFQQLSKRNIDLLESIFKPHSSVADFITRIIKLISFLKEEVTGLEKEYLFRFYTIFNQLKHFQTEYNYFENLKILHQFFNQLIGLESISFKGEPLRGFQLMGMLETRVLDFENIIISSANEGILPSASSQSSFIPFDVKLDFGLPTYKEKDAIYAYHFFRLLQRANNIYLVYNSENDLFGGGEKSRFLSQLLLTKEGVSELLVSPKVVTEKKEYKKVIKTKTVFTALKKLADKGLSPSAIANYLYNPYEFYKQKVLNIYEYKEVEETVASNTMGTIIHDTLEHLYKPFEGKFLSIENIVDMEKKTEELVQLYFRKHFNQDSFYTGKNRLIFEVSKRFINRFLSEEKKILEANNTIKILATEQKLEAVIDVEGIHFPIKLKGIVDRIDELNGVKRIIDYKTGMVKASELKISQLDLLKKEYKYSKSLQVMLYAFLYTHNNQINEQVEAGVISFKNLKSGVLKINYSEKRNTHDNEITTERIDDFMGILRELILEIYNPDIPFEEPANLPF